jgi:hypothetical protein
MTDALTFLQSVSGYASAQQKNTESRLGTIDPAYVSSTFPVTLPKVTFDGELSLTGKRYNVMGDYVPAPSDRVILIPCGSTYVIAGSINGGSGRSWVSHTPSWYSTGGAPSFGNATIISQYRRLPGTNIVAYRFSFSFGSSTVFGDGFYTHSLPLTASANSVSASIGSAYLLQNGVQDRPGTIHLTDTGKFEIISSSGHVAHVVPWTWASGDNMSGQVLYEVA